MSYKYLILDDNHFMIASSRSRGYKYAGTALYTRGEDVYYHILHLEGEYNEKILNIITLNKLKRNKKFDAIQIEHT